MRRQGRRIYCVIRGGPGRAALPSGLNSPEAVQIDAERLGGLVEVAAGGVDHTREVLFLPDQRGIRRASASLSNRARATGIAPR